MKKKLMVALLALTLVMSLMPTAFAAAETFIVGCNCAHNGREAPAGCKKEVVSWDEENAEEGATKPTVATDICVVCAANATCNPCQTRNCKLAADHTGPHKDADGNNLVTCTADSRCVAETHDYAECPKRCKTIACSKTNNHSGAHSKTACGQLPNCPNAFSKNPSDHNDEGCLSMCDGTVNCTSKNGWHKKVGGDGYDAAKFICLSQCMQSNEHCPNAAHATNNCTGSVACPNRGAQHHKDNCIAKCTYVATEYNEDGSVQVEGNTGSSCPNTSGNPSVHKAGCAKATVSDSVVLSPTETTSPEPTESVNPSEEPTAPVEVTKAEDFSDVNADDWFAPYLTAVVEKGWLKGNEDGSFDPNGEVSGQQAVVFVSRMLGKDLVTTGANWADEATAWAAEDGLTEGIEITSEGIARKDLILLLWRAAGKQTSDHEISFSDVDELEGDYLTALKWAVENKIIQGNDDGTATPNAATSRSEIAAILSRYDKAVNK